MVTTLLWMWSGCSTDNYQLTPGSGDELILTYSTGGDREPDPAPETDCKCYMRVNSVENAVGQFHVWGIIDETNPPPFPMEISGQFNTYFPAGGGSPQPLPSDFRELNPPSNGWHSLTILYSGGQSDNLKVNTEVRCYLQNSDGSETLATTTYHQFDITEGSQQGAKVWLFEPRQFSCLVLGSGGVPKD